MRENTTPKTDIFSWDDMLRGDGLLAANSCGDKRGASLHPFPFPSDFLELFTRVMCFFQIEPLTWISLKLIKSDQIVLRVSLAGPFLQSQDGVSLFCQLLVFFHCQWEPVSAFWI